MIDLRTVLSVDEWRGEEEEDHELGIRDMASAENFLYALEPSSEVLEKYAGIVVGRVCTICLFRTRTDGVTEDDWFWVIVGDIPPALFPGRRARNPAVLLQEYIMEMTKWIAAVRAGESVEGLVPVNAPSTEEWAAALEMRLKMLDELILSHYRDWLA